MQEARLVPPVEVLNVPGGQGMPKADPSGQYDPAGQIPYKGYSFGIHYDEPDLQK